MLSGPLPPGCELSTMYTAALATRAVNAGPASKLIELLRDADQRELRERAADHAAERFDGLTFPLESQRGGRRWSKSRDG